MAKGKKKLLTVSIFLLIVVILLGVLYVFNPFFGETFETPSTAMVQYVGKFEWAQENLNPEERYRQLVLSKTAKFGDLEIVSQKADRIEWDECIAEPVVGGSIIQILGSKGIQSDGCEHWNIKTRTVWNVCDYRDSCSQQCASAGGTWNGARPYKAGCNWGGCQCYRDDTSDYGGLETRQSNYGCWAYVTATYKGETVEVIDWFEGSSTQYELPNGVKAKFNLNPKFPISSQDCTRYENQYFWNVPEGSLTYDYEAFTETVLEDSQAKINVILYNKWYPTKVKLTMKLRIPIEVPTGTEYFEYEEVETTDLPTGQKTISFNIPTAHAGDNILIKPVAEFYIDKSQVSGVNVACDDGSGETYVRDVQDCKEGELVFAKLTGDEEQIMVLPKPTYLTKPEDGCGALNGYKASDFDDTICIRDDLADLTCVQRGCPTIYVNDELVDYMCMSDGECSQLIAKAGCDSDADCEDFGALCLANNEGKKFCVREELREIASNISSGDILDLDCDAISGYCGEGYSCENKEIDGRTVGICNKDTLYTGSADGSTIENPVKQRNSPILWVLVGSVLILIVVILIASRKK